MRDEGTAHPLRARDELNEQLSISKQLTRVTEGGNRERKSSPSALMLADERERAAESRHRYDRVVQKRNHVASRLESSTPELHAWALRPNKRPRSGSSAISTESECSSPTRTTN